jgi:ergothioneine biosynthesis protein EgtB
MKRPGPSTKRATQRHPTCKPSSSMRTREEAELAKKRALTDARSDARSDTRSDTRSVVVDFMRVRARTEELAAPLSAEDQILQSMPDASPTKWHRAHTTWFFETFILVPHGFPEVDTRYAHLFNSYYESLGSRHARHRRGMISRPSLTEVAEYRKIVDARVVELLQYAGEKILAAVTPVVQLGLAHEEQHQELILTDILHAFSENPTRPAYGKPVPFLARPSSKEPLRFIELPGGVHEIGARGNEPFVFDNEQPLHKEWVDPFSIADRLVTIREMKAFIADGGYHTASLWLSEGWKMVQQNKIEAPLYASLEGDTYSVFELNGTREARNDEPVMHLSFYEADAVAQYLGGRLPTEAEWEIACTSASSESLGAANFLDSGHFKPCRATPKIQGATSGVVRQMFGDAWEWTRSSYSPYPGYAASAGAIGEYNGKFMANQYVLRGGSYLTPAGHVRATYRNFWPADTRFQATGVRLARNLSNA